MKFILGKKLNMTQRFQENGTVVPVTAIKVGTCLVVQKKTMEKDGYTAVKCAYQEKNKVSQALRGIFSKFGKTNYQYLREFRLTENDPMYSKLNEGDVITIDSFVVGDQVTVQGYSKGKGFQGVVKRHGFGGGRKSHGNKDQLRMPGSAGATGPAHVFKGMRMGGRMGFDLVTVKGLEVIEINKEENIVYLKGAVPGARNGVISLVTDGEFEVVKPIIEAENKVEPVSVEAENISTASAEPEQVEETPAVEVKESTDEISASEPVAADSITEEKK